MMVEGGRRSFLAILPAVISRQRQGERERKEAILCWERLNRNGAETEHKS